ncbi:Chromate resistance exported protein [Mucilaginibacter pineti]|uniref:Chromate resistance exported protein n=1 Tax=Mucilaginibacter pineti TaxID=1391627 RepID=A0A1G6U9K9_9SPHI|nr:chromate resistance protein ChrB domain-containing protein [Mucilaginibacter pineti]SDD37979.1 Chromate resistance exported protein [Mucilaginibacter pineti]
MKWITREKLKVDRIACPWLIKWFSEAFEALMKKHSGKHYDL